MIAEASDDSKAGAADDCGKFPRGRAANRYRPLMQKQQRGTRALALSVLAVLMLAACSPEAEPVEPSPVSTSTAPGELTDEELLAELQDVYEGYLGAVAGMLHDGEIHREELTPWVTEEFAERSVIELAGLIADGVRAEGTQVVVGAHLAQSTVGNTVVSANFCLDRSPVEVRGADGELIPPADDRALLPRTVRFSVMVDDLWLVADELSFDESASNPCD